MLSVPALFSFEQYFIVLYGNCGFHWFHFFVVTLCRQVHVVDCVAFSVASNIAGVVCHVTFLQLTLDGNFAPQTGKHTAKVKAAYKRPHLHVNEDVHLKSDGAVLSTAAVVKHCGFYLGYQVS